MSETPGRKPSVAEFVTQQVHAQLQGDAFRAQLYDMVRQAIASQGLNVTVDDVRKAVRDEVDLQRPAAGGGLSPEDVVGLIRGSVLSDDQYDVGGAIEARFGQAMERVVRLIDTQVGKATDALQTQMLDTMKRSAPAPAPAPAPAAPPSDLSDQLLQDIYRAAREEVVTLRKTLRREVREQVQEELAGIRASIAEEVAATLPAPFTAEDARAIAAEQARQAAAAATARLRDELPAPLTAAAVRAAAEQIYTEAEARRQPPLTADDVRAIAREVAAELAAAVPPPVSLDAVRNAAQQVYTEAEARRQPPLTRDDVSGIAESVAAHAAVEAAEQAAARIAAQRPEGAELDVAQVRDIAGRVAAEFEQAQADRLTEEDVQRIAGAELLRAEQSREEPAGLDELAVRTLARGEVAEIIAEMPHPHSDEEIAQLAAAAAEHVLNERLEHGEAPVTPGDVRRLAREIIAAEGATRDELTKILRSNAPAPEVPASVIAQAVQEQMAQVMDQLAAAGGPAGAAGDGDAADRLSRDEVTEYVQSQLQGFVRATELKPLVAEVTAAQAAGGGGAADGMSPADVKRLVRDIIEVEVAADLDDIRRTLRQSGGGTRRA